MSDEAAKLQTHLDLLREEYVKLQTRLADVEKKYQVALAHTGQVSEDNFVSRLLKIVADLFDKQLYSDLDIKLNGETVHGHKFILAARSHQWGVDDLGNTSELDLSDIPLEVSQALLKWVYTDQIELLSSDTFLLGLLRAARRYDLVPLSHRCEQALMSLVQVKNCIRFYQTAEEIGAESLKMHCSELISSHWNDFTSKDFEAMPAPLAYNMFKSKSQYPLHTAIRTKREDIVFLYLVEHDSQLPGKLNEIDNRGDIALDLALTSRQEGIAQTLVKYRVDVNRCDHNGACLLHKAISRGDEYSAKFIIQNGANVNAVTKSQKESALHLVASFGQTPSEVSSEIMEGMASVAKLILSKSANVNAQDIEGHTPLHRAVTSKNEHVLTVLLDQKDVDLELQTSLCHTVLWLALLISPTGDQFEENSFAGRLIKRGSSPNAVNVHTGDSLLHLAARSMNEAAALFLATRGGNGNLTNHKGETPLHTACQSGLPQLVLTLLQQGANPNTQTLSPLHTESNIYRQTPLHVAITHRHTNVVKVFLDYKVQVTHSGSNLQIIPNFTLKDSLDQSVFALALWNGFHDIALQLKIGGANVNDVTGDGFTLLHQAVMKKDEASALFLLEHGADSNTLVPDQRNCLQLAIQHRLPQVVDVLCQKGALMNVSDRDGNCPLWDALESGQEDVASILIQNKCDPDMWAPGPNGCRQTLLHRAIDENNQVTACFLIQSMCDINSARRPGPNGEGDDEARDGQGPLHLGATWGLERTVQSLLEYNVDVNAQDADGKTALHIAIENQHHAIISMLLTYPGVNLMARDRQGMTPFSVAMLTKNNKAAQSILDREPTAAEQHDARGRNFLHLAIQKAEIEGVLFLISVHVNVNSRVQDTTQQHTPLHLAVISGSEMIVRNLILAGAHIGDMTPKKQTALHLAAEHDHSAICSVLLENNINFDAVDDSLSNALHIAAQHAHLSTVRILLTESRINAEVLNMKGQTALHMIGQYGKENAAAIFELFMETMPHYPIDIPDMNGNTVLMLAYFNGNPNLCKAIVRAGASMGINNRDGMSIFNSPVATRQLLFKLLDMLSREPPWVDGDTCLECGVRFGIKTRKHHCRHCGRLLCAKCSVKDMPIIKYNITKPVRVCQICFDVLTLGELHS